MAQIVVEKESIFLLSEENEKFRHEILNFIPTELLANINCEEEALWHILEG